MAINSIPELSNTHDTQHTSNPSQQSNQLNRRIRIKKWLINFSRQKHQLHYSDTFAFPLNAVEGAN